MTLADKDKKIETFPANNTNQPFAVRICPGRTKRSFKNFCSHRFNTEIQIW